jgi:outer membrane protein insertion porin family
LATNPNGTGVATNINPRDLAEITALATFTGSGGANPAQVTRDFRFIGGDTQLLGNFEYRIPIFGPIAFAAFADIGTVFNLRKGRTQNLNSNFLPDQPFLGFNSLSLTFLRNNPQFQFGNGLGVLYKSGVGLITRGNFSNGICGSISGPGLACQELFFRGDAQTNTEVEVGNSQFAKFSNFRSSVGAELRIQVPIVNVPFRLIYFINPNSRRGFFEGLPGFGFNERKRGFRFTVGRTF